MFYSVVVLKIFHKNEDVEISVIDGYENNKKNFKPEIIFQMCLISGISHLTS